MKRNMKQWVADVIADSVKHPLPLLSFPCVQLMDVSVRELVLSSDLQAKGMKLVASQVSSAASVSLMDLSVEAEAFGSTIRITEDEVPTVVGTLISDEDSANALEIPAIGAGRTSIYIDAIAKATALIDDRPIFAGVIGPFSLAGRLMNVSDAMIYCYEEPDMVHTVLNKATEFIISYIRSYKEVGANGVVVAEPLAGLISPNLAKEFSHPYVKRIIEAVQDDNFLVIYHNCGDNITLMSKDIYQLGAAGYHFGNAVPMTSMLPDAPSNVLVMGNVSPADQFLGGTPESIRKDTTRIMSECCQMPNYVISSGCDIPPRSSWDNIHSFFCAAQDFYTAK